MTKAEAQQLLRDRLLDSAYMSGVTAGWNAAQANDPEAALARIKDAYSRQLREASADLRAARAAVNEEKEPTP